MSLDGRIRLAVRREGVGGALRLIVGRGARLAVCSEDHVSRLTARAKGR